MKIEMKNVYVKSDTGHGNNSRYFNSITVAYNARLLPLDERRAIERALLLGIPVNVIFEVEDPPKPEEKNFSPGDVVTLVSDGVRMTISNEENDGAVRGYRCYWFSGVDRKVSWFPAATLKKADDDSLRF